MESNSDCANQQAIKYKYMKVKKLAVIFCIIGIVLYFADIFSDISLAVKYYCDGHTKFFYLTLFLVILSAAVSSVFSFFMYWTDNKNEKLKVSKESWILRAVFLILGIAPVLRNFDSLYFAWKSYRTKDKTEKQYYARRMIFDITDGSFLRLFEAFIESGPQLVLQIYIFIEMQTLSPNSFTETEIWQGYTMLISILSISSSIVAYTNSLRNSLDHKNELKWYILILIFFWRFFEIISRVIAMGLGISATPYFLIVFIVHFIVVSIWIYCMKTDFCDNRCAEKFYNVLLGAILTFVFFNPEDSPTRKRCASFYLGMFIENSFLMAFWFHRYCYYSELSFKVPAVVVQILSFCLSIIFMVIYYLVFHPTVGKLYKKKSRESDNPKNAAENKIQNGEAGAVLEMLMNDERTETVIQNGEAGAVLEVLQNHKITEHGIQNGKANTMLEVV